MNSSELIITARKRGVALGDKGGKFPVTFDRTLEEEGIL